MKSMEAVSQKGVKQLRGFLVLTFTSCCFFVSGENQELYSSLKLWILLLVMKYISPSQALLYINAGLTLNYINYD